MIVKCDDLIITILFLFLFFIFSIYLFYIYIVLQDLKMTMLFVELNIRLQE